MPPFGVPEGREYGDLVAERLAELVRSEPLESRDDLHRYEAYAQTNCVHPPLQTVF